MALPKVSFNITEGLGSLADAVEKTLGLVVTGSAVLDKVQLATSYQIFSLADAVALGIDGEGNNDFAYKHLEAFYSESGSGVPLWIMLVSDATDYQSMADINENYARKLVEDAKGEIRLIGLLKQSQGGETITEGLDEDVYLAVPKLQALCEDFANRQNPIRAVISGNAFSGTVADLKDYTEANYDKVLMSIANTDGEPEASIGLLLGRLAKIPTQRSIARVKDGEVEPTQAYFTSGQTVEDLTNAWDTIDGKGYVFMRTFPNRSGYFFTDDITLTTSATDYNSLARGLVMDEAVLIAQDVLIEELSDEIPIQTDGTIHPAVIKAWQGNVLGQIQGLMQNEGKISDVSVTIDAEQDVLTNNKVEVVISILPVGYAKNIEVAIGYVTEINE